MGAGGGRVRPRDRQPLESASPPAVQQTLRHVLLRRQPQGFVFFNDAKTAKRLHDVPVELSFDDVFRLVRQMQEGSETFSRTGGVHNAALCDRQGILLDRMDIGRHNALDKIYGYCLRRNIPVNDKIIVFSGRISSEILLKVAKIGCGVILSKSAPTALALELAENLGITTVGFVRGQSCNVYTHPQRIIECRTCAEPKYGRCRAAGRVSPAAPGTRNGVRASWKPVIISNERSGTCGFP